MSGKATVNVDDALEETGGPVRGLRGEKLPAASYVFLPNLRKGLFFAVGEGSRFCRLFSKQLCLCQTPGRRRPLITGRSVNSAVRDPALDAISIRAAVVYVPLLLCAGWRQHTGSAAPRCC